MLTRLLQILVHPLVVFLEFFNSRKNALFELIALAAIALAVGTYLWRKTPLHEMEVDVRRNADKAHEKILKESFGNSRFVGPKQGQSKVIRSVGDAKNK